MPDDLSGIIFGYDATIQVILPVVRLFDEFIDVVEKFAALVQVRDDVEAVVVLKVLKHAHDTRMVHALEDLNFCVLMLVCVRLLYDLDRPKTAHLSMNTESDLATNDVVPLSTDFLSDAILFSYWLLLVFKDKISRFDLEVVHLCHNFLVSFALSGGFEFSTIRFSIVHDLLRSDQFLVIRREI